MNYLFVQCVLWFSNRFYITISNIEIGFILLLNFVITMVQVFVSQITSNVCHEKENEYVLILRLF
jgi:hypothetical protein